MALCWGFLAATIAQAGITVVPVVAHGWKKLLSLSDRPFREMDRLIVPLILSGLLYCFPPVAERYFASGFPDGQVSYIGYAYKIASIFVSLLSIGIASAIFPSMARAYAQNGLLGLAQTSSYGLRLSFVVALPAIVITGAAAVPAMTILFQRGAFHPVDTIGASRILFPVLLSDVLFRMAGNIFTRSYYVLKDTLTPSIVGSAVAILYIGSGRYFADHAGYVGLVWARTIQNGLFVVALWFLTARTVRYIHGTNTFLRILAYTLAGSLVYIVCRFVLSGLVFAPAIFQLAAAFIVGVTLYLLVLYRIDREMLNAVLEMVGVQDIRRKLLDSRGRTQQKLVKKGTRS